MAGLTVVTARATSWQTPDSEGLPCREAQCPAQSVPGRAGVRVERDVPGHRSNGPHPSFTHPKGRGHTPSRIQAILVPELNATRCSPASPTSAGGPISYRPQRMARPLQVPQPAAPHSGSESLQRQSSSIQSLHGGAITEGGFVRRATPRSPWGRRGV